MNTYDATRESANVNYRAEHLFESGYTMEFWAPELYTVISPAGKSYIVDTEHQTCTCPYYTGRNDGKEQEQEKTFCKHLLGIEKLLLDQFNAQYAEEMRRAEEEENGEGVDASNGTGWHW